jgi:hypothetical protein
MNTLSAFDLPATPEFQLSHASFSHSDVFMSLRGGWGLMEDDVTFVGGETREEEVEIRRVEGGR